MDNPTTSAYSRLGLGLIEIGALASLLGSSAAELLALGERGSAGLPWAAISTFGSLSIIRACVAATTPCWLRESLGMRNAATDTAVGMQLRLRPARASRDDACRKSQREPLGVLCGNMADASSKSPPEVSPRWTAHDVYAFDRFIYTPMEYMPASPPEGTFYAYRFMVDPGYTDPIIRADWLGLLASTVKITEPIVLWFLGARGFALVSCCCWFYLFTCGTLLQLRRLSRGYPLQNDHESVDVVAGQLPTPNRPGGERKVLLGGARNFRSDWMWKLAWAGGALVSTVSLIAVYVLLAQQEVVVTYTWLSFQAAWLVLRSAYFHISHGDNTMRNPLLMKESLDNISLESRRRVVNLLFAISRYQMHVHPRGLYSYAGDLADPELLRTAFSSSIPTFQDFDIKLLDSSEHHLSFRAVIGDTLLSSAAWMFGSKLTGYDLYDSCIVFISIENKLLALPCARVLCAISRNQADIESGRVPQNPPRGSFNWGPGTVRWIYWIPCSDGRWLQIYSDTLSVTGRMKVVVIPDEEITRQLSTGEVNVSHKHVDDIRSVVQLSESSGLIFWRFMGKQ